MLGEIKYVCYLCFRGPSSGGKDGWVTNLLQHLQYAKEEWGSVMKVFMLM